MNRSETNKSIPSVRPIRAGDKVIRDAATHNTGKVHLGDDAPAFGR
jgi:hypothetical protein